MAHQYEVRVHGVVSARVLESLCAEHEMTADTVLHGAVQDQAALQGLIARISDFGLELIDLRHVP
jgi:hypothetical protein